MALDPDIILHATDGLRAMPTVADTLQLRDLIVDKQNQRAEAQRQRMLAQAQTQRNIQVGQTAATGDFAGAQQQALQAGDFDLANHVQQMDDASKVRLHQKVSAAAPLFATAAAEPDPAKRAGILEAGKPYLAQLGYTPDELAKIPNDQAGLQAAVSNAQTIDQIVSQQNKNREFGLEQDKFAETKRHNLADENKPITAQFGSSLINPRTGAVVFDGSGGTTAGAGGATSGKTIGGWTPRARNGGDNSDAVVDNKIGGMAQSLGIDATTPFPAGMTNYQIAQALSLSEGGKGSLADRNNNPANLTDPKTGAYRKFPTKEAGLQAAAQQVARNRARGQNTIQTMVEGIPQGGGGTPSNSGGAGGMTAAAIDLAARQGLANGGTVPAGYSRNRAAQAAITNRMAELASGQDVGSLIQQGQTTKSQAAAFKTWNSGRTGTGAAQVRSLNTAVDHLDQLRGAAAALKNGNVPLFNQISQGLAKATGSAVPTNFDGIKDFVLDEVTKAIIGAGGGVGDREKASQLVARANSPDQLSGAITQIQGLMAGQIHNLSQQYTATTGRKDFDQYVSARARNVLEGEGRQRPQGTLSANIPTFTPDQARNAPKGTRFKTTDGRIMVRQ